MTVGATGAGGEGAAILVVEDFAALRVLLTRVLGASGHRVVAAETLQTARAACEAADFDLVVTDVAIPGGNGTDLARQLAAERPGLRVLFVSGSAPDDLDLEVPGARTDFLQKPFDIDELVVRVGGLLDADAG
jgi:two-component system, cell cycle sensor histidine kinase and response regulator CckA